MICLCFVIKVLKMILFILISLELIMEKHEWIEAG